MNEPTNAAGPRLFPAEAHLPELRWTTASRADRCWDKRSRGTPDFQLPGIIARGLIQACSAGLITACRADVIARVVATHLPHFLRCRNPRPHPISGNVTRVGPITHSGCENLFRFPGMSVLVPTQHAIPAWITAFGWDLSRAHWCIGDRVSLEASYDPGRRRDPGHALPHRDTAARNKFMSSAISAPN